MSNAHFSSGSGRQVCVQAHSVEEGDADVLQIPCLPYKGGITGAQLEALSYLS